jgi:hypothetical protein
MKQKTVLLLALSLCVAFGLLARDVEAWPRRRRPVVVCPQRVTSDTVRPGMIRGYIRGRPMSIRVIRLEGKPVEVRTAAAFLRLQQAAGRAGVQVRIVSGFRTMRHQQALYCAYRYERGNLAARPGYSNHQSGHALDLNTGDSGVYRWLTQNARRFGFRRTVPSEPWHWEWW